MSNETQILLNDETIINTSLNQSNPSIINNNINMALYNNVDNIDNINNIDNIEIEELSRYYENNIKSILTTLISALFKARPSNPVKYD